MAEDPTGKQIRLIEEKLMIGANEGFNKMVYNVMQRIERQVGQLQTQFFTILAAKTMGVSGPPRLGQYTPMWKPLSDNYTERREDLHGIPENVYYSFSGKLEHTLSKLNPKTFFGAPVITYQRGAFKRKSTHAFKPDSSKDSNFKARISVDLYPRVLSSINEVDEEDLFNRIKIRDGRKSTPISYRLKNYQGASDRPFVALYMQWWLNVQARAVIRKATRR